MLATLALLVIYIRTAWPSYEKGKKLFVGLLLSSTLRTGWTGAWDSIRKLMYRNALHNAGCNNNLCECYFVSGQYVNTHTIHWLTEYLCDALSVMESSDLRMSTPSSMRKGAKSQLQVVYLWQTQQLLSIKMQQCLFCDDALGSQSDCCVSYKFCQSYLSLAFCYADLLLAEAWDATWNVASYWAEYVW